VKSVLVEIGQILGGFNGKYAVIGGAAPWLLLDNHEMPHVGTLDVDLGLDPEALGEGEYARLVETLMGRDYKQSPELRKFQLVRTITPADGGIPIDVIVDFLMPRDAVIEKNKPPIVEDFAVQPADGADLALHFNELVAVRGAMPNGGTNKVEIAVCSIPALLAMKGHAVNGRYKQKDSYDIYYCVRNYPGGVASKLPVPRPCCSESRVYLRMRTLSFGPNSSVSATIVQLLCNPESAASQRRSSTPACAAALRSRSSRVASGSRSRRARSK
jgi:hypothetical protein